LSPRRSTIACQVVGGADAREHAVQHRQRGLARRHERAHLRQQHDQAGLADVGALARHVRPGDEQHPGGGGIEVGVVGNEFLARARGEERLHHRVPPGADLEQTVLLHQRTYPAVPAGDLRQGLQRVERRHGLGGRPDSRGLLQYRLADALEDLPFQCRRPLVGTEHLPLHVAEFGRGETLGIGQRLLPLVVRWR